MPPKKNTSLKPPTPTPVDESESSSEDEEDQYVKEYLESSKNVESDEEYVDHEHQEEEPVGEQDEEHEDMDPILYSSDGTPDYGEGCSIFGLGLSTYAAPLHLILNLIASEVRITTREKAKVTLGVPYTAESTKAIKRAKLLEIKLYNDLAYKESEYETTRGMFLVSLDASHCDSPIEALQTFIASLRVSYIRDNKIKVRINADGAGALFIGFKAHPDQSTVCIRPDSLAALEDWRQTLESGGRIGDGVGYSLLHS